MASSTAKVLAFRVVIVVLVLVFLFYVGRPMYWKISATIHEIQQNKRTVSQGISQIVLDARRSMGWHSNRKMLQYQIPRRIVG